MRENAVIDLIRRLCDERSWSCYKLAKESGIAYSALSTMFRKTNTPSVETIIKICDAFGITLSQFFSAAQGESPASQRTLLHLCQWEELTPDEQDEVSRYISCLLAKKKAMVGSAI